MLKKLSAIILTALLAASLTACGSAASSNSQTTTAASAAADSSKSVSGTDSSTATAENTAADKFTERDLEQTADTDDAKSYTLSDGKTITITEEGVYVISGSAKNAQIIVEAADNAKVQLVLDNVTVTNDSTPAVYVKNADKVFVTTNKDTVNTLSVTGTFTADGDTNTDAVIFAKDDIVLNGEGTLKISSTDNGISGKDDIKITGGTIDITCTSDAIEAKDSISVADGNITINSQKDGLHAENSDDDTTGEIYISDGTFNITAASDGIQATTVTQIDGGTITIDASEGIEGTNVIINDGTINITASDDGINGSQKSSALSVFIKINGGDITINMGQGDTDGIDSNGDLYINGGTINVTAQSPFDYDGTAEKNGGTIIVNGTETDEITNQMMGGGMGGPGGMGGGNMQGGGRMGGQMPDGDMPGGDMGGFGRR